MIKIVVDLKSSALHNLGQVCVSRSMHEEKQLERSQLDNNTIIKSVDVVDTD